MFSIPSTRNGGTLPKASSPLRMLGRQEGCQQCFHSFLLHCETETLMPQIQIVPHFGIAELQAYILEGGSGNEIHVKGERGAETAPESHTRHLNI